MGVLYPCFLAAITPYGVADMTVIGPPPGAFTAIDQRAVSQDLNLRGLPVTTLPGVVPYWQLRLAITQDTPLPYDIASVLQRCRAGDVISWVEAHTRRDRVRFWDSQVLTPDSGGWVVGNPEQGDFFTVAMTCFAIGDPTEA